VSIRTTKRFAAITVVLVLLVTAVPVSAMCCAQSKTTAMSSMACCASSCTMSAPDNARDRDATLIPAPQPVAVVTATLIAPIDVTITARPTVIIIEPSPPPFLINAQFRI